MLKLILLKENKTSILIYILMIVLDTEIEIVEETQIEARLNNLAFLTR